MVVFRYKYYLGVLCYTAKADGLILALSLFLCKMGSEGFLKLTCPSPKEVLRICLFHPFPQKRCCEFAPVLYHLSHHILPWPFWGSTDFGLDHVTCFGWGYAGRSGSDWVLSLDIERPGGLPIALWGPCPCQEKGILWAGPWLQEEDER